MTLDVILRTAAVVAAIALVASPGLVAAAKAAYQAVSRREERAAPSVIDDACVVVAIARRLQQAGIQKGVDVCQQLIGILLSASEKK